MELVPIITQILGIVAAIFIIVLLASFVASKVRKKDKVEPYQSNKAQNLNALKYARQNMDVNGGQYYGGDYYNNNLNYSKEIKVVKRSSVSKDKTSNKYRQEPTITNLRFTVINSITGNEQKKIETDEFGFKVYANNEITRSVYFPN